MASEMLRVPCAQDFVDQVRDEAGLTDPLDKAELAANRRISRRKVDRIVEKLAPQADWNDDLSLLNYVFTPELIRKDLQAFLSEGTPDPTSEDELFATTLAEAAYLLFVNGGFQRLFFEIARNIFTEFAITGNLAPTPALPAWFTGNTFSIPFLGAELVISISTPFSDRKKQLADLKDALRQAYVPGQRDRPPKDPQRDRWVMDQYIRLRESVAEQQDHERLMADILDLEEDDILKDPLLDQLLALCLESPYADQLSQYNLTTKSGKRTAKVFLSQVIFRQRALVRQAFDLLSLPPDPSP